MNQTKLYLLILLSLMLLLAYGCRQNESTIVQPNIDTQLAKTNFGTGVSTVQSNITNGDMENGTTGYWNGGSSITGYTFQYSAEESVSPSHSLSITADGTAKGSFAYWAQSFDASSFIGKKVTLTVSVKYINVDGDGVMFALRGDNTSVPEGTAEAFSTTQGKILLTGTSDWTTLQVNLDPVPEDIKSLTIYMLLSADQGSVYFDNLGITVEDASLPLTDITNGNFETGNYSPDNWWNGSANNSAFEFAWDKNEFRSPGHSVKIGSVDSGDNFAIWAQTITASELIGKKISLNVYIKGVNLTGSGIYIAIRGDDTLLPSGSAESFATTQGNENISGNFDWKMYSVTLNKVPDNTKSLTFYLIYGSKTSGTAYFDDVSLTKE